MENQLFSKAQGTVEYLVIMAVVIVIGLLVVGMMANFFDSSTGVSGNIGKINALTGPISISETVVDSGGDGYSVFTNNSGESLTVTKVILGGVDNNYNKSVAPGGSFVFDLDNLLGGCTCSTPGEQKTCSITVYFTSVNGISNSVTKSVTVDCVGDATTDQSVVNSQENDAPVISLSSSIGVDSVFTFSYGVVDDSDVASCDLILNGVVDQTDSVSPFGTFTKNYLSPQYTTWDVNCTDEHGNEGSSIAQNITDTGPYYLSDCIDLNAVSYRLDGNYIQVRDINCFEATHSGGELWNSGAGFAPIGINSPYFEGYYDGNNHLISSLFINRSTNTNGLFGRIEGTITNLGLIDLNVISTGNTVGGLAGLNGSVGVITKVYVSGNISSKSQVGMLAGRNFGTIDSAYTTGLLTCSQQQCGGLVGDNQSAIYNSYSDVNVATQSYFGTSASGGLVGISQGTPRKLIINSFASGAVTGTGAFVGGLIGMAISTDVNNSFYYNFAGNPGVCVAYTSSSTVDCTPETEIDYFQGDVYPASPPFDDWNFFNIWEERANDFPSLTWQGLGGSV